jgi:ABC-type nitrate/sulfonate/bicarbonate transport system permease component
MDELLSVMGASRWKSFLLVRIPQALPGLFAGLRIAVTYSIMGAVISEWVGAQKGLGIYMTRAMTSFKTAVLFADVLIIVLLSMGLYKLVEIIERKITKNIIY